MFVAVCGGGEGHARQDVVCGAFCGFSCFGGVVLDELGVVSVEELDDAFEVVSCVVLEVGDLGVAQGVGCESLDEPCAFGWFVPGIGGHRGFFLELLLGDFVFG